MNSYSRILEDVEERLEYWENKAHELSESEDCNNEDYRRAVDNEIFWGELVKSNLEAANDGDLSEDVTEDDVKLVTHVYLLNEKPRGMRGPPGNFSRGL